MSSTTRKGMGLIADEVEEEGVDSIIQTRSTDLEVLTLDCDPGAENSGNLIYLSTQYCSRMTS